MEAKRKTDVVSIGSSAKSSDSRAGQALAKGARVDCFELRRVIGSGSFGITYEAYDHELERLVAIKEYFPRGIATRDPNGLRVSAASSSDGGDFTFGLRRFIKEARALAQFTEPNIVRVLRYLEAHGTGYLVMNLEEGRSLSHVVRNVSRLREKQIRALAIHLLRGLAAVHRKDFLHRDVKPANILVRASGPPILLDFGAARLALEQQRNGALTVTLTPGYAPIEQYGRYEEQGPWTDLYGLGATLYHCLLKASPPNATDRLVAIRDQVADPVTVALDSLAGKYSAELVAIVEWLLKPRAADRPRRAREVLEVLGTRSGPTKGGAAVHPSVPPRTSAQYWPPTYSPAPPTQHAASPPEWPPANDTRGPWPTLTTVAPGGPFGHPSPSTYGAYGPGPMGGGAPYDPGTMGPGTLGGGAYDRGTLGPGTLNPATLGPGTVGASALPPPPPGPLSSAIPPEVVAHAKRELSGQLGPIAAVLVSRAASAAVNEHQFFDLLAEELDTKEERESFFAECAKVSRAAIR